MHSRLQRVRLSKMKRFFKFSVKAFVREKLTKICINILQAKSVKPSLKHALFAVCQMNQHD